MKDQVGVLRSAIERSEEVRLHLIHSTGGVARVVRQRPTGVTVLSVRG